MKKISLLLITLFLLFGFVACSGKNDDDDNNNNNGNTTETEGSSSVYLKNIGYTIGENSNYTVDWKPRAVSNSLTTKIVNTRDLTRIQLDFKLADPENVIKSIASVQVNGMDYSNDKIINVDLNARENINGVMTDIVTGSIVVNRVTGKKYTFGDIFVVEATTSGADIQAKAMKSSDNNDLTITVSDFVFDATTGTITSYVGVDAEVTVPSKINDVDVKVIGENAFGDYTVAVRITSVVLPEGITTIGKMAFFKNDITTINIPSTVTTIEAEAFVSNQLTSITIPEGVTTIGNYAFAENQLTSITIPESVTTIGDSAFAYNDLTSITIPSSVTTIGNYAFGENPLTEIIILGDETRFNDSWESVGFPIELMPHNLHMLR